MSAQHRIPHRADAALRRGQGAETRIAQAFLGRAASAGQLAQQYRSSGDDRAESQTETMDRAWRDGKAHVAAATRTRRQRDGLGAHAAIGRERLVRPLDGARSARAWA